MGFPLELTLRYMRSKKSGFVSVGTLFALLGVAKGVAALAIVMSVTGGFRAEFRQKVLGVNAHVLILKHSDFPEYRKIIRKVEGMPGVTGVAPFVIDPMMVTHKGKTATGVLLKGVDPKKMPTVLDLPTYIVEGQLEGLRQAGAKPPERRRKSFLDEISEQRKREDGISKSIKKQKRQKKKSQTKEDVPFLKKLEKTLDEDTAKDPAEKKQGATNKQPSEEEEWQVEPGDPIGNIVPDGGYESELPEEDILPNDVDPDPCENAEAVRAMPGIVVGKTLKENLGLKLGDCVQVTSPTIGFTYSRGTIRAPVAKQFRLIAVFDAGFDQYDSKLVYTDLYEAQNFGDAGDSVTGIEIKVADIDQARPIARQVDKRLDDGIYYTMDWEELNHGLFTALRVQQIVISILLALIIVVAAFTVIATLIMMVLDKKKEIAVLKAMGASNSAVLRTFLYQGGIIGVLGTSVGLLLGYAGCRALATYQFPLDPKVYFISQLPVQIRPTEFALVGVFALLVCLVATVWPATYAARLRPADAFREQ